MKRRQVVGFSAGIVVLALSWLVAGIVCAYLTEQGARRLLIAVAVAAVGTGMAVAIYFLVSKYCTGRAGTIAVGALLVLLLLLPPASAVYGRVTYSRFGLTIYGLIPVPVLDITVGPRGGLWFRDKSHFISLDEVEPLLSPDVEVVVIGIGWDSAVRVDPAVKNLEGVEVEILPTPAAFELFNRCVSEDRVVVLIAHSSC